jgi:hypothetical protein
VRGPPFHAQDDEEATMLSTGRNLSSIPRRSLLAAALGGLGAAAQAQLPPPAAPAMAPEPQTWSIGVSQTVTNESNLFRLSDGDDSQGPREDWVSSTGLNLGLNQALGRQRLRGQASLQHNRYREHDELDSTGHDLRLVLDWETVGNLSGDVGAQLAKRQYRYGLDTVGVFDGRNDERTQSVFLHGRWGGMGLWALQMGAEALRRDYSAAAFATQELSQQSVEGGVAYRPSPDLGGSLVVRHTRIERDDVTQGTPPTTVPGDDVTRNDIDATVAWQATGASRLEGRLTRSQENHSVDEDRGFWTGSLAWLWVPSGKLNFATRVLRDTEGGSGGVLNADPQLPTVSASDQLRTAFEWTANWQATAKIQLLGTAQWSRRSLGRVMVGGRELNDRTQALSVGLRYEAARWLDMGCDLRHERRETNASEAAELLVTRPYDATAIGCSLAFWFR